MLNNLNRRQFLAASAVASASAPVVLHGAPMEPAGPVAFFVVGDTHFLADKDDHSKIDARAAAVTGRLVEQLNKLPGSEIPEAAGGGKVLAPRGVIHAGDCIDTGDKPNVKMQATEWAAFADTYGLTGSEGRLLMPVYEVHGNHDSPRGDGLAVKKIIERNKKRAGVGNVSHNGVHYSWDWGGVHFIALGIVVGQVAELTRKRRYAPLESLPFLIDDLAKHVGTSGKPVVIVHHIDLVRYSHPLPVADAKASGLEWDPADVNAFYQAVRGYNIAAVFYGHTHVRNIFRWDGTAKPAAQGVPVFNVDNSSHFAHQPQAFFYCEMQDSKLTVREFHSPDAWQTAKWTPQTWTIETPAAAK